MEGPRRGRGGDCRRYSVGHAVECVVLVAPRRRAPVGARPLPCCAVKWLEQPCRHKAAPNDPGVEPGGGHSNEQAKVHKISPSYGCRVFFQANVAVARHAHCHEPLAQVNQCAGVEGHTGQRPACRHTTRAHDRPPIAAMLGLWPSRAGAGRRQTGRAYLLPRNPRAALGQPHRREAVHGCVGSLPARWPSPFCSPSGCGGMATLRLNGSFPLALEQICRTTTPSVSIACRLDCHGRGCGKRVPASPLSHCWRERSPSCVISSRSYPGEAETQGTAHQCAELRDRKFLNPALQRRGEKPDRRSAPQARHFGPATVSQSCAASFLPSLRLLPSRWR